MKSNNGGITEEGGGVKLDPRVLLLADSSACLRRLVLMDLLKPPSDDDEAAELGSMIENDPLVSTVLRLQRADGCWHSLGHGSSGDAVRNTYLALKRLGFVGLRSDHPAVVRGIEYLFSLQQEDGSWSLPQYDTEEEERGYSMIPLQTALPLASLAQCGYAADPRAEKAYDWLLTHRLDDGAWPTGIASGAFGRVAGYRRIAHSRWGCRSNTTGVLTCLAYHPTRRTSEEAHRALDLLLGRETRDARAIGYEVARAIGTEENRGFLTFYARFDIAQMLDLCWRVGASIEDKRVADFVEFVMSLRGRHGLWHYRSRPQASRWVSYDLIRSISRLEESTDWQSTEAITPFQAYPAKYKRF